MTDQEYEFDVAISFHMKDQALALELEEMLRDRFKTFIFQKQQEHLAGTNGETSFNEVFEKKSRVIVVLIRGDWGETKFTRVEKDAIQNRSHRQAYENFVIFVPTDGMTSLPPWIPRNIIYWNLAAYGMTGLVAVVAQKIQEAGGHPNPETAATVARRVNRQQRLIEARQTFNGYPGIAASKVAVAQLHAQIKEQLAGLNVGSDELTYESLNGPYGLYGARPIFMSVHWKQQYSNTLNEAGLIVRIFDGVPNLSGYIPTGQRPKELQRLQFRYDLMTEDAHGFTMDGKTFYSASELAADLLKRYLMTVLNFRQNRAD